MVGTLQYLTMTRPDFTLAVHVVSQFMHALHTTHMHAVKRIFRYSQETSTYGLQLCPAASISLIIAYSNANQADCKDTCRSTISYAIFFGPNLISWHSKKQPTISKSSTETKYRAVAYVVAETSWIRKLLSNLGICPTSPTKVYYDNISASYMAISPVQHYRSKHIAVDYHFDQKCAAHGDLVARYIPTKLQLADVFTKGLSSKLFDFSTANLSMRPPEHIEWA